MSGRVNRNTVLTYCTTGVLLRRLQHDSPKGITHIIVDEIHERSVLSDFLLFLLKRIIRSNSDIRIILMSATLNETLFSDYFGGVPSLSVEGRLYKVEERYLDDIIFDTHYTPRDFIKIDSESVRVSADMEAMISEWNEKYQDFYIIPHLLRYIFNSESPWTGGVVLVFLSGVAEIKTVGQLVLEAFANSPLAVEVIACHGSLSTQEQHRVFEESRSGYRVASGFRCLLGCIKHKHRRNLDYHPELSLCDRLRARKAHRFQSIQQYLRNEGGLGLASLRRAAKRTSRSCSQRRSLPSLHSLPISTNGALHTPRNASISARIALFADAPHATRRSSHRSSRLHHASFRRERSSLPSNARRDPGGRADALRRADSARKPPRRPPAGLSTGQNASVRLLAAVCGRRDDDRRVLIAAIGLSRADGETRRNDGAETALRASIQRSHHAASRVRRVAQRAEQARVLPRELHQF